MTFAYKLEHEDGTPADPHTFNSARPDWNPGDVIPLGSDRALRVVDVRHGQDADVLVVEPSGPGPIGH
jgi:hypothetical protein